MTNKYSPALDLSARVGGTCLHAVDALAGSLLDGARAAAPEPAFRAASTHYPRWYRTNERLCVDRPDLAASLFQALQGVLPAVHHARDGTTWDLQGINPRIRFCRYGEGQAFLPHQDGPFHAADGGRSWLTLLVYLSGPPTFTGGTTRFLDGGPTMPTTLEVTPAAGDVLVFDHALWHDGAPVTSGAKHVLRSDVVYTPRGGGTDAEGHRGYAWGVLPLGHTGVLSHGRDGTVCTWDVDRSCTPRFLGRSSVHAQSVLGAALGRDGALWTCSRDGTVARSTLRGGTATVTRRVHLANGALTRVTTDGDGVLVTGADGLLCRVNEHGVDWQARTGGAWNWAASRPGETLCVASDDGLYVGPSPHEMEPVPGTGGARCLAMDGHTAWLGTADGALLAVDAGTRNVERVLQPHAAPVTGVSVRGAVAWSSSEDGGVVATRVADGLTLARHRHANMARGVCVLADGTAVSAGYDGKVLAWPAARGTA